MFTPDEIARATVLLQRCRAQGLKIATAESCTGGLVAALLTEVSGSSDVFERGFVTYSNEAKSELLGVDAALIARLGAVSREVAVAMAEGALAHSRAGVAVAITGVAGPGGGTPHKPVGLVYIAARSRDGRERVEECRFGPESRGGIRRASVAVALTLLEQVIA